MKIKKVRNSVIVILCITSWVLLAIIFIACMKENLHMPKNKADVSLTSTEFISDLEKGDNNAQYVEKTIEIEGEISKINYKNKKYTIMLHGNGNDSFILCEMQKTFNPKIKEYLVGDTITVRGIYKGKLMDAIFLNCAIIEKNATN